MGEDTCVHGRPSSHKSGGKHREHGTPEHGDQILGLYLGEDGVSCPLTRTLRKGKPLYLKYRSWKASGGCIGIIAQEAHLNQMTQALSLTGYFIECSLNLKGKYMKYYLIGCGGIGGWLAMALVKTLSTEDTLILVDGDVLEEKNLDRQLFSGKDIGKKKVHAMRRQLKGRCTIEVVPQYLGEDHDYIFAPKSIVLTGVDNHPARVTTLKLCDKALVPCITAANGYEDAEAFYYAPIWQDTALDPRIYYPEILEDTVGDPLRPPCTGEILESTPQLAIANMSAASYAMWLLWFWQQKAELIDDPDVQKLAPVQVISTAGRVRVKAMKDFEEQVDE